MRSPRRGARAASSEGGFALLLVFAMAAAVAIMLYLELPRVAFEAQRSQEQLLIERGEQYKRAIQLYFRKFKQYPATMEALETTNNVRFLRRRYADPLTGKDEWRLIHVGPGGVFTDSITQKKKKDDTKQENHNFFITEGPALGSTIADAQKAAGPRRRASEGGQPQPGDQQASDPNAVAAGQVPPGTQSPGVTNVIPAAPVSGFPGVPASPFNPSAPQSGTMTPDGAQQPGSPGNPTPFGQPGADPSQPGGAQAADLIRNLLTRPRPFPGSDSATPNMTTGGSQIGGGIAGVASKVEKPSIKIYNERDRYNEWEFIYDFAKDRTGAGQFAGNMGSGDPRLAQQQAGQAGGMAGGGFAGGAFGNAGAASGTNAAGSSSSSNSGGISTGYGIGSGGPAQTPTPAQRQGFPQQGPQPAMPGPPPAQPAPAPAPPPPPDQTNPQPDQTPPP
jgi:hypothetical protein